MKTKRQVVGVVSRQGKGAWRISIGEDGKRHDFVAILCGKMITAMSTGNYFARLSGWKLVRWYRV